MYETLFDKITINNKELKGIIDYVTKKQVLFYDFTNVDSCAITLLVMEWKTNAPEERFSIFAAKNFPLINIGNVSIVQRKHVTINDGEDLDIDEPSIDNKIRIKISPNKS